jgi:acyl-CoA thioesterase-1
MRSTLLLIALLLLGAAADARTPVIMVLGDSISAGYGIDVDKGWVALLQQRLEQRGLDYKVINSSISGDTTSSARARLPSALQRHHPAVVIIELGGNDGLRGLSLKAMRANLQALVATARRHGAKVLLLGIRLPPNYGPAYTHAFHQVYIQVARSLNAALVPFLLQGIGGHPERMQGDGIHPAQNAQQQLLDNVWPHLEPLLQPIQAAH